jgi:hypothetical protein
MDTPPSGGWELRPLVGLRDGTLARGGSGERETFLAYNAPRGMRRVGSAVPPPPFVLIGHAVSLTPY